MKKNTVKILDLTLIVFLMVTTASLTTKGQESRIKTDKRISCSMAGLGDPWEVLTEDLEKILVAFHKGYSVPEIASAYKMTENQLINKLEPLVNANIVTKKENDYFPDILILTEEEALNVYNRAKITAQKISGEVILNWTKIEKEYNKLTLSKTHELKDKAFMLVGSRILDVGVLRALVINKELLLPAPIRPTPNQPNSKYYLWIKENSPAGSGFGQKDVELKFNNWFAVNFGSDNESREILEKKAVGLIESGEYESPENFAQLLDASFLNKMDSERWDIFTSKISDVFLKTLLEEKNDMKEFYRTLKTSEYSKNTYYDFYCCYYHSVYGLIINELIVKNFIKLPPNKHTTIILYNEKGNGVYFK